MTEIKIETMSDILALTPDQFERFLPDLSAWYQLSKMGMETGQIIFSNLTWFDDGLPGQIHSIDFVDQKGNLIGTFEGPAFQNKAAE